jgi:hypothetical protein
MKLLRSFSFAAVLTLSAFAGLIHAQNSVQGKFNLPYAVNWGNTVVPSGDYEFYLRPAGGSELLTMQKIGGAGSWGFFALVRPPEPRSSGDANKLVFGIKEGQRFVSSMQLPEFGMSLAFAMPEMLAHSGKQMARAEPVPVSSSGR